LLAHTTAPACGRAHTTSDVAAALDAVRASSVRSWGLDLISGLPGLTRDTWAATLAAAVAARPHHVSVYDLQVEPGTAFGRWYTPGTAPLPSEGDAAQMYRAASHALTAAGCACVRWRVHTTDGALMPSEMPLRYEHYEVSNFALPGRRCAHNMRYWRNASWHAFGVAAANQVGGRRFTRPRRLCDYVAWVRAGGEAHDTAAAVAAAAVGAVEAREERLLDTLMLVRAHNAPRRVRCAC
jgi:oxygen-independent coproporphyrinogen-3 oxidase